MPKKNKTRSEYILDVLLTGKPLLLSDITRMVSEVSGKESKVQDISSLMSKLSSSGQCPVGHFIHRAKTPQGYEYSLIPEIGGLAREEIYDLTRKTGKNRFSLEAAAEKIPELAKYIVKAEKPVIRKKTVIQKTVKRKNRAVEKAKAGKKTLAGKKAMARKTDSGRGLKPLRKALKSVRRPLPKPPEPVMTPVSTDDFVNGLMEQISTYGGPRLNVYLTVTIQRG